MWRSSALGVDARHTTPRTKSTATARGATPLRAISGGASRGLRRRARDWTYRTHRRSERRRWDPWRQAYRPRRWPTWLFTDVICALSITGVFEPLTGLALVLVVLLMMNARLNSWRRRHPVLLPFELMRIRQRWGPFN
jgi:hypothetical protein